MRSAAVVPVALAMSLAIASCEPPEPVQLGPQGSGGIAGTGVSGAAGATGGGAATDGDGAGGDDGGSGLPSASSTPSVAGQSLVDAGPGAAFAQRLDPEDIPYFQQAEISARVAATGSTINWGNPGTGNVGSITVVSDLSVSGQDCRIFFLTATIGQRQHTERATACRNGSEWVIPA